MKEIAIQKTAKDYAKRVFGKDFVSMLYLGKDKGVEGFNIYEFKLFLKTGEFYFNVLEIQKGRKRELLYDLTPKE